MAPSAEGGAPASGSARKRSAAGRPWRKRACDPFKFDKALLAEHGLAGAPADLRVAGVDEVGRGCLAGPLVAAAVVLDYGGSLQSLKGLTDSKLLTAQAREVMYARVLRSSRRVSWAACSPSTIDRIGLHRCNVAALRQALQGLEGEYGLAVVDAFNLRTPELRSCSINGADYKSAAVAAASIVAKVVRDRLMRAVAPQYPEYGFEEHVGYATHRHREALRLNGPCFLHRLSFQGVETSQLEFWEEYEDSTGEPA